MINWIQLIYLADEFLVTYFSPPYLFENVRAKHFTIGHALELYLKAFYFKNTNEWKRTVKFGHGIWHLLEECQKIDPTLLTTYKFKRKYHEIISNQKKWDNLGKEDLNHLMVNNEFYQICKYKGDLKYLGLPRKKNNLHDSTGFIVPNKYWALIFSEIRDKLSFPPEKCDDSLKGLLNGKDAPPVLKEWIKIILKQSDRSDLPVVSTVSIF